MREDRRLDNKDGSSKTVTIEVRFKDYAELLEDEALSVNDIREAEGLPPLVKTEEPEESK